MSLDTAPTGLSPLNLIIDTALGLGYWPAQSLVVVLHADNGDHVLSMRCDLVDICAEADGWRDYLTGVIDRTGGTRARVMLYDPASADHWEAIPVAAEALLINDCAIDSIVVARSRADHLLWTDLSTTLSVEPAAPSWQQTPWSAIDRIADGADGWRRGRHELVAEIAPLHAAITPSPPRDALDDTERDLAIAQIVATLCDGEESIDALEVLRALADVRVRDTVMWEVVSRPAADWRVAADALVPVVQRARPGWVAPVATILGLLRWQLGDGTRSLIALERAMADDPDYVLAQLILGCLQSGMTPSSWREGLQSLTREQCRRPA